MMWLWLVPLSLLMILRFLTQLLLMKTLSPQTESQLMTPSMSLPMMVPLLRDRPLDSLPPRLPPQAAIFPSPNFP